MPEMCPANRKTAPVGPCSVTTVNPSFAGPPRIPYFRHGMRRLASQSSALIRSSKRATSRRHVSDSSPAEAPPDSILGSDLRDGGSVWRYFSVADPFFYAPRHGG